MNSIFILGWKLKMITNHRTLNMNSIRRSSQNYLSHDYLSLSIFFYGQRIWQARSDITSLYRCNSRFLCTFSVLVEKHGLCNLNGYGHIPRVQICGKRPRLSHIHIFVVQYTKYVWLIVWMFIMYL